MSTRAQTGVYIAVICTIIVALLAFGVNTAVSGQSAPTQTEVPKWQDVPVKYPAGTTVRRF